MPCRRSSSLSAYDRIHVVSSVERVVIFSTPITAMTSYKPEAMAMLACFNAVPPDAQAASTRVDSCCERNLDDRGADRWHCSEKWLEKFEM